MLTARILAMLLLAMIGPLARAQDAIELRPVARVEAGHAITLADVAGLSGTGAESVADLVLVASGERSHGPVTVDIAQVRRALLASGRTLNWGLLTLSGSSCTVLPGAPEPAPAPPAEASPAASRGPTVRTIVIDRLAQILGAEPQDLRVGFDDADREVLDMAAPGRTVDVRAVGSSSRLPLAVTVYQDGRIIGARTVRAEVLVRRAAVLAVTPRRRGELIGPDDVRVETQWLAPDVRAASLEQVVGAAVRSRLTPGQIVTPQDVEAPLVVGKGELVAVHCVVGTVVVRTTARALAPARDGEIVRLESLAEPGRIFHARMDGRGRAIAVEPDRETTP